MGTAYFLQTTQKYRTVRYRIEAEKAGDKWRAVELLNRVERNKFKTKEASSGYLKADPAPPILKCSLSCSGQQNVSTTLPHSSQTPFSKGVIQIGPSENGRNRTRRRKPSLRKECDHQINAIKWATEPGKNVKTKSLWAQRFFRNPYRKPFHWLVNTFGDEVEEGRKEIWEEGIDVREEDTDRFNKWNSSDSEDSEASEDGLSVPDSEEGESDPPELDEILPDVSKLFKEEFESNTHHDLRTKAETQTRPREENNLTPFIINTKSIPDPRQEMIASEEEEEDERRKMVDMCGRPVKEMTHEEWKVITKVVEGVEIQEVPKTEYKHTNRGKSKKGMRELRELQNSFNNKGTSRKKWDLNFDRCR